MFNHHGRIRAVQGKCAFQGEKSKQPVYPAGVSLFWSSASSRFYNSKIVDTLKTQYNVQIVRAAMTAWSGWSDGYTTNPSKFMTHAETIIEAAIAAQIYVIVDWHCEGDNSSYVEQAKDFFGKIAQKYGSKNSNIIYEIWNEPTQQKWSEKIRPYCVQVVQEIRKFDPLNLILCGTETWSQRVQDAAKDPIQDVNLGYVLHFYSNLHGPWLYNGKQSLNVPVFVTEWGTPGDHANTRGFVQWLEENKIPHCSWAWNNKNENLSYLTPTCQKFSGPYDSASDLTVTGKILTKIIQEWSGNRVAPLSIVILLSNLRSKSANCKVENRNLSLNGPKEWASYALEIIPQNYTIRCSVRNPHDTLAAKFRLDYDAGKTILATVDVPPAFNDTVILRDISIPNPKINLGIFCISGNRLEFSKIELIR